MEFDHPSVNLGNAIGMRLLGDMIGNGRPFIAPAIESDHHWEQYRTWKTPKAESTDATVAAGTAENAVATL